LPTVGWVIDYPLELDGDGMRALGQLATEFAANYLDRLPTEPVWGSGNPNALIADLLAAPPQRPRKPEELLTLLDESAAFGLNPASGGYLAYFPAGGLPSAAVAEQLAMILNRYTGFAALAPGLVALEQSVIRWLCGMFGLPPGSGGLIMSGGSLATLPAVVAARESIPRADRANAVLYVGEHAHYCVAKAAHLAGFGAGQVRIIPSTSDLRMDVRQAATMIAADRAAGLRPLMLAAAAGATSTGLVDPLDELGALAGREGLWFHVDGAYGAAFQLTERGANRLAGIELADSMVLDPHKTLFMPYGTGVLLVRDEHRLHSAHAAGGDYLQDIGTVEALPDYATLGPELTREWRGLRLWLPLHLHGVAAFRAALDEKLDLANWAYAALAATPGIELAWVPDLTVVGFRFPGDDATNRALLDRINATGRVFLSSTRIHGRFTLRMCPLSLRTHAERVEEALQIITAMVPTI
jgi:aromatic-L-amino-acid/L-tryptophan decarboxylase